MIVAPAGWTRHTGAHVTSLYPPDGGGRIRCFERVRPVQRFSQVIDLVLARDPEFRASELRDVRSLVTVEGEYGACARLTGTREGHAVSRLVGAVFADEYVVALDAFTLLPARRALVERTAASMLVELRLGLGVRRRRFLYPAPAGWSAVPSGLVATWYPPGFPRAWTTLVVMPAEPTERTVHELLDVEAVLAAGAESGALLEGQVAQRELVADNGIAGRACAFATRRAGAVVHHELVAFVARSYAYVLRLEVRDAAQLAAGRAALHAVACSFEMIPEPERARGATHVDVAAHWVD